MINPKLKNSFLKNHLHQVLSNQEIPALIMTDTKKTVLITGSTRGIGLAVAEHYTKAGWNVIGTARAKSNTDQVQV